MMMIQILQETLEKSFKENAEQNQNFNTNEFYGFNNIIQILNFIVCAEVTMTIFLCYLEEASDGSNSRYQHTQLHNCLWRNHCLPKLEKSK